MVRIIAVGVWIALVAFMSCYVGMKHSVKKFEAEPPKVDNSPRYSSQRTGILNIPVVKDGEIAGHLISQFVYVIDNRLLKQADNRLISGYINDTLLTELYGIYTGDAIKSVDLEALKGKIVKRLNDYFGNESIKSLIITHFVYVNKK